MIGNKRLLSAAFLALLLPFFSGKPDENTAPSLLLNFSAISPNSDTRQDVLEIRVQDLPEDLERPDWKCEIKNAENAIVRSFVPDRRLIRPRTSWIFFLTPDPFSIEPVRVFDTLYWDGRDEAGVLVPDGKYTVIVHISAQDLAFDGSSEVTVDPKAPSVRLQPVESVLIRPSEDGQPGVEKNLIRMRQISENETGSIYTARIYDDRNRVVETRTWRNSLDENAAWNGKVGNNEPAEYGNYSYTLSVTDAAGNASFARFSDLIVSREAVPVDLRPAAGTFSPNGDANQDTLRFEVVKLNRTIRVTSWKFEIFASNRKSRVFYSIGAAVLPESLLWTGKDERGRPAPDGVYYAQLTVYDGLSAKAAAAKPVILDRAAPRASVGLSSESFSPDNDGERDTVNIEIDAEDDNQIREWFLNIELKTDIEKPFRLPYRSFYGQGDPPSEIRWDGISIDGKGPLSFENFVVTLTVWDMAGNIRTARPVLLSTELILNPVEKGSTELRALMPLQKYFQNQELTEAGRRVVTLSMKKFRRYRRYNLHIEVHSDLDGREEENLKKTEARAWSVFEFLSNSGMDVKTMDYRGYGETEPVSPPIDAYARYKNERIQFYLTLRQPW